MKKTTAIFLLFIPFSGYSQIYDCPLDEGKIIISDKKENYGVNELGTTIISTENGRVKSFVSGRVVTILKDESSDSYMVIIDNDKNYISFNGLKTVNIKKDDMIKVGEKIGKIKSKDKKYHLVVMNFIDNHLVTKPFENSLKCRKQYQFRNY